MSKVLKIKFENFVKRIDFPVSYQNFLKFVEENIKKEDDSLYYKFVEEKTSKEIKNEDDYDELKLSGSFIPKIVISFIPKEEICIKNEIENSNDNINENIPETNMDDINEKETNSEINNDNEIKEKDYNENNDNKNIYNNHTETINKENSNNDMNLNVENIENKSTDIKNNNNNNNNNNNGYNNQDINSKIHDAITSIVKEKMKKIQETLIEDIYKNVQIKDNEDILKNENNENIQLSMLNKDSLSLAVHNGIKCNECNCPEIVGPRFKCLNCNDYNLCQKCEEETEHNIDHIFIKIYQNNSDSQVDYDSINIKYKNEGLNYFIYQNNLKFKRNMTNIVRIKLKNNGSEDWEYGFKFHCLNDYSELIGESVSINSVISPNTDIDIDLIFKLDDNEMSLNNTNRSLFVSYWQMFTFNDLPFGEVTKFIIKV